MRCDGDDFYFYFMICIIILWDCGLVLYLISDILWDLIMNETGDAIRGDEEEE
jgi:hypothetical protein